MTENELINVFQKNAKINLSTKERHWIQDNIKKRRLYFDDKYPLFISLDAVDTRFQSIIQDGKNRKLSKVDCTKYAIVVSNSGRCQIFLP